MSVSKKVFALVASLVFVLVLSTALLGCSEKKSTTETPKQSTTEEPKQTTGDEPKQNAVEDLKLVKDGKLTVGSDCDYPPFISLEGDKPVGFEYDLLQALAGDMGLTLEYLPPQNFDTLIASVQGGGKMDLAVSSLTITDERKQSINFCTPYFNSNQACVTLGTSTYTSATELADKVVGAQSGTTGEAWANENIPGITMKVYNQTSEGLAALQAGDIEALFFDAPIAEYQLQTNYPDMKIVEVIPTAEQYGFGVSKDNAALEAKVNASLKKLIGDGTYEQLFKKYFPNLEPGIK
jgi:polar amino acid transport system substrate-binding protein